MFVCEYEGVEFDLMMIVKGLMLGYVFMGVVLMFDEIFNGIVDGLNKVVVVGYGQMYLVYLVSVVVVFEVIKIYEEGMFVYV